ncbi:MAG: hypothetical protein SNJ72_02420 [Fimbriimonadales bacterium]
MAIFRMFADILVSLSDGDDICSRRLEHIAATHSYIAYYGNRKDLQERIKKQVSHIRWRNQSCNSNPLSDEDEEVVRKWFSKSDWARNSGSFPDFVLEWEGSGLLGDGAIIELKDSKGEQIASFNSTLPEAKKRLSSLSKGVLQATIWYQDTICKPISIDDERDCFYLVRTHCKKQNQVRLSLVHGAFFETVSTRELLKSVWEKVLKEAEKDKGSVCDKERESVLELLSALNRETIAQTRRIEGASIKPRLRIMAEVEREGNPHTYNEIPERTFNLIFKDDSAALEVESVVKLLEQDGVEGTVQQDKDSFTINGKTCHLKRLSHKRNGDFVLIQYQL